MGEGLVLRPGWAPVRVSEGGRVCVHVWWFRGVHACAGTFPHILVLLLVTVPTVNWICVPHCIACMSVCATVPVSACHPLPVTRSGACSLLSWVCSEGPRWFSGYGIRCWSHVCVTLGGVHACRSLRVRGSLERKRQCQSYQEAEDWMQWPPWVFSRWQWLLWEGQMLGHSPRWRQPEPLCSWGIQGAVLYSPATGTPPVASPSSTCWQMAPGSTELGVSWLWPVMPSTNIQVFLPHFCNLHLLCFPACGFYMERGRKSFGV